MRIMRIVFLAAPMDARKNRRVRNMSACLQVRGVSNIAGAPRTGVNHYHISRRVADIYSGSDSFLLLIYDVQVFATTECTSEHKIEHTIKHTIEHTIEHTTAHTYDIRQSRQYSDQRNRCIAITKKN